MAKKLARVIMDKDKTALGVSAQTVADLGFMELIEAKRALHRLWLDGGVERHTLQSQYYYMKKLSNDEHTGLGN